MYGHKVKWITFNFDIITDKTPSDEKVPTKVSWWLSSFVNKINREIISTLEGTSFGEHIKFQKARVQELEDHLQSFIDSKLQEAEEEDRNVHFSYNIRITRIPRRQG